VVLPRKAASHPQYCPIFTWTGWTSSSRQFSYRNTPEENSAGTTGSIRRCNMRSCRHASAVTAPRRAGCGGGSAACPPGIPKIPPTGVCATAGTPTYAEGGISRLMPTPGLCRVAGEGAGQGGASGRGLGI